MPIRSALVALLLLPLTAAAQNKPKAAWVGEVALLRFDRDYDAVPLTGGGEFRPKFLNYVVQSEAADAVVIRDRGQDWRVGKDGLVRVADAEAFYAAAIRNNAQEVWAYYGRACARMELGDLDGALQDASVAVGFFPDSATIRNGRGAKHMLKKNYAKALLDFNQAVSFDPTNDVALCNRGYLYFATKDYDKALLDFGAAARLDPRYAEPIVYRGKVQEARGKYLAAAAEYEAALRIDAKHPAALMAKARMRAACPDALERNGQEAVTAAKAACAATFGKDGYALVLLAMAHAESRNFPEAVKQLDRATTGDKAWAAANADFLTYLREEFAAKRPYRFEAPKK
ncbi:tetratricopeptide repeat protein [Limnoglobus roseus]|uniref:Tetratricopeptide repeat protein n=1 Tax=Limnoglobus roseus TaxID=2598579 RepID=A0A5C1ALP2_9BACT|nr:tetratricopeptide repeat protein [Limnoglobus roseus]QEL19485.1 tetratricopeptide repeat protein [Limnoglobus roseus]